MISMATRNPGFPDRTENYTEFQLYVVHGKNVVDFTAVKLRLYAAAVTDPQQKLTLAVMVDVYIAGHIAIAWKRGNPIWLRVTKNA